ncbi:MAG TPA: hypothetical protein VLX92_04075 [Kofleriaceae bacterium]|nr:hypothetical protein [Kofleriaceae bacterium]
MSTHFETITIARLSHVTGGADNQQTPPPRITTGDVVNTAGHAAEAVLAPPTLLGHLGQAYRQFNDPRVGNGFWDRAAYGFTGLFGIDPLKK